LKGHYLGIASLGFALVTYNVLMSWVDLTQGPLGIYGIAPPPAWTIPGLGRLRFNDPVNLFYLVAGFALLVYLLLDSLLRSPIGPVIGAVLLPFLPELLRGTGDLRLVVYGLALTLVVLFLPGGIVEAWQRLRGRLVARRPAPRPAE